MDDALYLFLVVALLAVGAGLLVIPIVALVRSGRALAEARKLAGRDGAIDRLRSEVDKLSVQVARLEAELARGPQGGGAPHALDAEPASQVAATTAAPAESAPAPASPEAIEAHPPVPQAASTAPPAAAPSPPATTSSAGGESSAPAAGSTLEERIALVWFTRVGAAAVLLGAAYFFKYAVDNHWIGPLGRVALGALVGAATLGVAEVLRPRTKPVYVNMVVGVALAVLFLSAWASHVLYHLVGPTEAFAAFVVIIVLGGALSIRHKGEPILVLSLIGGYLAPVLLSTHQDRAAALFAYLLVLTVLAFVVALRMGFALAAAVAVAGPVLLGAGWWMKFFDVTPARPPADNFPGTAAGAYFSMAARAVPLGALAAFVTEWIVVAHLARARALAKVEPLMLDMAALLFGHVGAAALLFDRPVVLGGALVGLGGLGIWRLGLAGRRDLLWGPMVAAIAVLFLAINRSANREPWLMLALLAVWSSVYLVAFLRPQLAKLSGTSDGAGPSPLALSVAGGVGLAFLVFAWMLLGDVHARAFVLVAAALSLGYASLAAAVRLPAAALGAAAASLAGVLVVTPWSATPVDHRFIAVTAAWAAVYIGVGGWELVWRKVEATPVRLLTVSLAGLAFLLVALPQTEAAEWALRATLFAAVGAIDLALGAALVKSNRRRGATVLLGQALGLIAAAVAFLLSGAAITVVWAVMVAVVAWIASDGEDEWWLAGALMLSVVVLVRLVDWDLPGPARAQDLFFATMGKHGALRPLAFVSPRSLALVGSAAGLLAAARGAGRSAKRLFQGGAATLAAVGHALLLLYVTLEVHGLALKTPVPPAGLHADEFRLFAARFGNAVASQQGKLTMLTTLVFALYAAVLVAIGFGARSRVHRYLGLGLFAITLGKLVIWDIWKLPRIDQMAILLGLGVALLGSSYLYARLGKRLTKLLRDGSIGPALMVLIIASGVAVGPRARALDLSPFAHRRAIRGIDHSGWWRLPVDARTYQDSAATEPLADVRLVGPDGKEVPYLVRPVPGPPPATTLVGTMVDSVVLKDGSARAIVDLGRQGLTHSQVDLTLAGHDFLRRTRIEISNDERHWAVSTEGEAVYAIDLPDGASAHETSLEYPVSDARYLRITLLPPQQPGFMGSVRILDATLSFVLPGAQPQPGRLPIKLTPQPRPPGATQTVFVADLGARGVPVSDLVLDVATPAFARRVSLAASDAPGYWIGVGGGLIYRGLGIAVEAERNLTVDAGGTRKRYLRLTIDDGDDAPLQVRGATAEFPPEELVFSASAPGPYHLFLDAAAMTAPRYDLADVLARSPDIKPATATLGPVELNPRYGRTAAIAPRPAALTDRHPVVIGAALVIVLLGLGLYAWRLLRAAK